MTTYAADERTTGENPRSGDRPVASDDSVPANGAVHSTLMPGSARKARNVRLTEALAAVRPLDDRGHGRGRPTADPTHEAGRIVGRARRPVDPTRRSGRPLPATHAGPPGGGHLRRRPWRARPGREPVATGRHWADGAQLPLRWRGGQRVRTADGCGRDRGRRGPGHARHRWRSGRAAHPRGHRGHLRRAGAHPRRGQHRRRGRPRRRRRTRGQAATTRCSPATWASATPRPRRPLISAFTGAPARP